MNNMDKKVLIYCRVSTQQQTTDRQKEELLKFAAENHWNVEEEDIFIDVISGFKKVLTLNKVCGIIFEVPNNG